jgi:hypothetical protein
MKSGAVPLERRRLIAADPFGRRAEAALLSRSSPSTKPQGEAEATPPMPRPSVLAPLRRRLMSSLAGQAPSGTLVPLIRRSDGDYFPPGAA